MKILICGGSKSGKSAFGERIALLLSSPHYYVATMIATDAEDKERIRRHVDRRSGLSFQTLEQGRDLTRVLERRGREGTFLVEAVTSLLANEMFGSGTYDPEALERVREDMDTFLRQAENVVLVFDNLYLDAAPLDQGSEAYRRALAQLQMRAASICDLYIEVCLGEAIVWKESKEGAVWCKRMLEGEEGTTLRKRMDGRREMGSGCSEKNQNNRVLSLEGGAGENGSPLYGELVIGGAYQGKTAYVREKYGLAEGGIQVCSEEKEPDLRGRFFSHLERYVLFCLKEGKKPELRFAEGTVLISDDISCGIVPMDPLYRRWREETGLFLRKVAGRSRLVTRVSCGFPSVLKKDV